jgi:hypothetical protein
MSFFKLSIFTHPLYFDWSDQLTFELLQQEYR